MRLGRIEVSPGFLVLAAWLNYMDNQNLFLPVVLSCVLHELGHLWVLRMLKIPVKQIRVTAVGAEICVSRSMSYGGELFAALTGPGVNFLLAFILCHIPGGTMLAGLNLVLGCFNLLPIGTMDGGRALSCLLSVLLGPELGERIAQVGSYVAVLAVCGVGLAVLKVGGNLTLVIVALWLLCGMSGKGLEKGRKRKK